MIRIAIAFVATLLLGPAWAAETCHTTADGQFGKMRYCVSSVLAPQAGNTYGPNHLDVTATGDSKTVGAWCEGAPGPGIGQSITLHHEPPQVIGTILIMNGYAKSDATFRANGRVERARIDTDSGYTRTITLKDTRETQKISIRKGRLAWVKMTILSVYSGDRHSDTCISEFLLNVEEFANEDN
jgi:hypothetical protein